MRATRYRRPLIVACLVTAALLRLTAVTGAQDPGKGRHTFAEDWAAGTTRTIAGEVSVLVSDDFQGRRADVAHMLRDERTGQTFSLRFEQEAPGNLRSGTRAQFTGRVHESELLIAGCCDSTTPTSSLTITGPSGEQRTLAMIVNFADSAVSCSLDDVNNVMFADPTGYTVANLYAASSLGKISVTGRVVGPYVINARSTDACDSTGWALAADAAATASGVDLTVFPRRMYVMPRNTCQAAGLGTVGDEQSSRAWIFDCGIKGVFAHEYGHNLGMDHASSPTQEFGDNTDPMKVASGWMPGLNAPHRRAMGWVDAASAPIITQTGTFVIAPLSSDPISAAGPTMLVVPKSDTNERYYLSFRTPMGFDRYVDGAYQGALSIHRYGPDGSFGKTFLLAGLAAGESFVDSVNGINITHDSHTDQQLTVRVEFTQPCVTAPPTLEISPSAQTAPAGTTLTYGIVVTNRDSANCSARTLTLTDSVPSGWVIAIQPGSVTLAPGGGGQAAATLTSSVAAAGGTYQATIRAADNANVAASTVASYTVQTPQDTSPPTTPTGLTASVNSKRKLVTLSWQPSTDDRGVSGYSILRNGVLVGRTTTTGWTDLNCDTSAIYAYTVAAYDASGNVSVPSDPVSATFGGGGGGKKR